MEPRAASCKAVKVRGRHKLSQLQTWEWVRTLWFSCFGDPYESRLFVRRTERYQGFNMFWPIALRSCHILSLYSWGANATPVSGQRKQAEAWPGHVRDVLSVKFQVWTCLSVQACIDNRGCTLAKLLLCAPKYKPSFCICLHCFAMLPGWPSRQTLRKVNVALTIAATAGVRQSLPTSTILGTKHVVWL